MKSYLFILMTVLGSFSLRAQSTNNKAMKTGKHIVYAWQGKLALLSGETPKEILVSLQYQKGDTIAGQYHKQLIVGKLTRTKTRESQELIGYVQNQRDTSYHFYVMNKNGRIQHTILSGISGTKMEGYWMTPGEKDYTGALELHQKDTAIVPTEIKTTPDQIYGDYQYDFGPEQPEGHLSIHRNEDGTVNFKIYSKEKNGAGYVAVHQDSIPISGTSFIFDAKAYGVTIWSAKVQFYKDFVVVGFVKPNADSEKFGRRSTVEGIFRKKRNH